MLVVFSGTNTIETRRKAHAYVTAQEEGGAEARTIDADGYETGVVRSLAQAMSLFGGRECIVLDTLSENALAYEELMDVLPLLAQSENTFVVIEDALDASSTALFTEHAEKMEATDSVAPARFNVFQMADALASKDKKTLWMLFLRAEKAGLTPEEMIGTLFWQLKSLRLAKLTTSAKDADMKDFPYNKAKRAATKFTQEELHTLSESLVKLYHEGHLGKDISLALEQWVLSI